MQRIISMQVIRDNDRGGSEYVSKRLCCSFLFSVAFLSLLGGFLLCRYSSGRAHAIRNAVLQYKQQTEMNKSIAVMHNLTSSMHQINNLTRLVATQEKTIDYKAYYRILHCSNIIPDLTEYENNLAANFTMISSKVLRDYLGALESCFESIRQYLEVVHKKGFVED